MKPEHQAFRTRAAAWLLLAFACVQFLELAHQSEHSALDVAERCATCVQLDNSGPGQAAAGDAPAEFAVSRTGIRAPQDRLSSNTAYRLPARAPPES